MRLLHKTLKDMAEMILPKSYLEVGVREGDSLRAVLDICHPERLVLCDTWGSAYGGTGRGNANHIRKLLKEVGYKGKLMIFNESSHVALPKISCKRFDLINIDGDHSYNGALTDLRNAWKLLKPGGILVFDDIIHPDHKYLEDCINNFINETPDALVLKFNNTHDNGVVALTKSGYKNEH